MVLVFFDFFIYIISAFGYFEGIHLSGGATICNGGASPYGTDTPPVVKIIIPMKSNVFYRNERTFKHAILFNQFEMVYMIPIFLIFFIHSKSTFGAAEGVSVPLPLGVNDPLGRSIGTGATICNGGKIIIPMDPKISMDVKERSNILYFSRRLKRSCAISIFLIFFIFSERAKQTKRYSVNIICTLYINNCSLFFENK